jgi:predicted membrane protein DUF2306
MSAIVLEADQGRGRPPRARRRPFDALEAAARLWFVAAVIGQAIFLAYIVALYFPSTLTGNFAAWNANKGLIHGYVPGDVAGNLAFAAHVLMAGVIAFGGMVQLTPQIRARFPAIHRWNGRAFLATAMAAAVAGLVMTWTRAFPGAGGIPLSLDAVLILAFAVLAWRRARTRRFDSHRRWAMRTFMVANAVWFLRLGFAPYGMIVMAMGGKVSMSDPFFVFWSYGCYLVPLAILELYFLAKDRAGPAGRTAMAVGLVLATAAMSVGVLGAWVFIQAPTLARL